jgi:delta24-sterol reductase
MEQHNAKVAEIATQVKLFHTNKVAFRIYHGSTNSTRPTVRHPDSSIDVSSLVNVISIDTVTKVAIVEPNVPMDALVTATLKHNLVAPVVPEFPGITVGGGFAGTAGESSSFKWSFLDATVVQIELITAKGQVMTASKTSNSDLFYGAAGTLGTLGVLTLLHIQLIDAAPYVALTYHPVTSFSAACTKLSEAILPEAANDFVDSIMFSATSGVVLAGKFSHEKKPEKVARFTRARDPWFYLHAQKAVKYCPKPVNPHVEHIPLVDYLFRFDRGGFWVGKFVFDYFGLPYNRFTRALLDPILKTRALFHSMHASGLQHRYIIQDVAVPLTSAPEFLAWLHDNFRIYPLWLCPLKFTRSGLQHTHIDPAKSPLLLNIGLWGEGPVDDAEHIRLNRALEAKVADMGGAKWLYAQTYYTEREFWAIYKKDEYESLRETWGAQGLPDVFAKVKKLNPPPAEVRYLDSFKPEVKGGKKAGKDGLEEKKRIDEEDVVVPKAPTVLPGLTGTIKSLTSSNYIMMKRK